MCLFFRISTYILVFHLFSTHFTCIAWYCWWLFMCKELERWFVNMNAIMRDCVHFIACCEHQCNVYAHWFVVVVFFAKFFSQLAYKPASRLSHQFDTEQYHLRLLMSGYRTGKKAVLFAWTAVDLYRAIWLKNWTNFRTIWKF